MKSKSDHLILIVAILSGIMLLMVFVGDFVPGLFRLIVFAVCIVGMFCALVLKNLIRSPRGAVFRKIFAIGYLVFGAILVSVILFDDSFVAGDPLRFGMEPATAMFVFGVTLFPFVFVLAWVIGFDRAIVTPEKEERFKELTEEGEEDTANG